MKKRKVRTKKRERNVQLEKKEGAILKDIPYITIDTQTPRKHHAHTPHTHREAHTSPRHKQ